MEWTVFCPSCLDRVGCRHLQERCELQPCWLLSPCPVANQNTVTGVDSIQHEAPEIANSNAVDGHEVEEIPTKSSQQQHQAVAFGHACQVAQPRTNRKGTSIERESVRKAAFQEDLPTATSYGYADGVRTLTIHCNGAQSRAVKLCLAVALRPSLANPAQKLLE